MPDKTQTIKDTVIRITGISKETMESDCRKSEAVICRHLVTHYSYLIGGLNYSDCGCIFSHTARAAFHSTQVIRFYRLNDNRFSPMIQAIDDELLNDLPKRKIRSLYKGMRAEAVGRLAKANI